MFTSPTQILCTIFGIDIYCYGVVLALAIFIGAFVAEYCGKRFFNLQKDTIYDLALYLVVFGVIGARLYYCALNYDFYISFPTEILALRHGGISIHGALLGGFAGLIIYCKRHKLSILKMSDVTVLGVILGQAIGRWGNFFNSEAFGYPTELPWKLYIAPKCRPIPYSDYQYFHPTFLYESILDIIIFVILFFVIKKHLFKRDGNVALLYLILYSIVRIIVEHFRIDSVVFCGRYPIATIISVGIICVATFLLIINNWNKKGEKE